MATKTKATKEPKAKKTVADPERVQKLAEGRERRKERLNALAAEALKIKREEMEKTGMVGEALEAYMGMYQDSPLLKADIKTLYNNRYPRASRAVEPADRFIASTVKHISKWQGKLKLDRKEIAGLLTKAINQVK
jgi:uncharacterized protein YdbL (DUF1318 family)